MDDAKAVFQRFDYYLLCGFEVSADGLTERNKYNYLKTFDRIMQAINSIKFENKFIEHFNGDDSGSLLPRQTPGMFYSKALPTPVKNVTLLAWSDELAKELEIKKPTDQKDVDILGGNLVTSSMFPYAACYAGHQFGSWAGQLGDGRAITLGERVT